MELARPGVKEGMEMLLGRGVDEIVCHPYFLGPGRHVSEDIPRLVKDAAEALDVQIPVRTTAHVGSDAAVMLGTIHGLVKQSSTLLAPSRTDRL
jgi:sirohydrochlorin ferrochelatase